jgi:hypothetical protein
MSRNPELARDPKINRLLAREAIAAYRTGRKPDFDAVLQSRFTSGSLPEMKLVPYDLSIVHDLDPAHLN